MSEKTPLTQDIITLSADAEARAKNVEELGRFDGRHSYIPEVRKRKGREVEKERVYGSNFFEAYRKSDKPSCIGEKLGRALKEIHDERIAIRDISKADLMWTNDGRVAFLDVEFSTQRATPIGKAIDRFQVWDSHGSDLYENFHTGYTERGLSVLLASEPSMEKIGEFLSP